MIINYLRTFDHSLFSMINQLPHYPIFDALALFIWQYLGLILVVFAGLFWIRSKKNERFIGPLALVLLALTATINQFLLKPVFQRERPLQKIEPITIVYDLLSDYSFPSGHAASVMAFTVPFFIFSKNRKVKYSLAILVLLVGHNRIYMGHHYPLDVLAGYVLGGIVSSIGCYLWRNLIAQILRKKLR